MASNQEFSRELHGLHVTENAVRFFGSIALGAAGVATAALTAEFMRHGIDLTSAGQCGLAIADMVSVGGGAYLLSMAANMNREATMIQGELFRREMP